MNPAILLSLGAAFANALSRTLTKYVLRYADTRNYLSVNFTILFALLLPFAPFFLKIQVTPLALALLLGASLFDLVANYFYFRAFEIGDAGTVSALLSLGPLFTLLISPLAAWFVPLSLNIWDIVGTAFIVAGIALLNRELRAPVEATTNEQTNTRRLLIPLAASFLLGINAYPIKYIFTRGFMNPFTYYFLRLGIIALSAHIIFRPTLAWVNRRALSVIAGRGIFVVIQWLTILTALQIGDPPIVKAVSEVSPLFVILLSLVFLKEPPTRDKIVGASLIMGGLFLIAL